MSKIIEEQLYAALLAATTTAEIIEAVYRAIWYLEHGERAPRQIPSENAVFDGLYRCSSTVRCETWALLTAIYDRTAYWILSPSRPPALDIYVWRGPPMDDWPQSDDVRTIEQGHADWRTLPEETRPDHFLTPLIRSWIVRPPGLSEATVTVTINDRSGFGMIRRPRIVSTLQRTQWTPTDEPLVTGAVVDGEPMAALRPDTDGLFPVRERRPRRLYKPGEQHMLPLPVVPGIPHDLRLIALQALAGDPILQGDVLALLAFAWAADRPLVLTEREGAALLARTRDGHPRPPHQDRDGRRFWKASYELRVLVARDPDADYRWADLATVEIPDVNPVDRVTIGPPAWARVAGGKWTLTAESSAASIKRVVSGQHGMAGRMITGIEYRLASGYTGRSGTVAPDLRPAYRRKDSPGAVVELDWRTCLRLSGDWWDESENQAARKRFDRAVSVLRDRGYFVSNLRAAAPAGDSVEIVDRIRAARGRSGGLMVRASARFVEAARLAQSGGHGFETRSLADWAGLQLAGGRR